MSVDASESTVESFLKNNPRLMGVLFAMLLLLSSAGSAAAGGNLIGLGP